MSRVFHDDPDSLAPLTDDELTALALAADPEESVGSDAVSMWDLTESAPRHRLPEWYMPTPAPGAPLLRGWKRRVVLAVIASFLLINAYGLCNTYGQLGGG
jgi:hypothetical protein